MTAERAVRSFFYVAKASLTKSFAGCTSRALAPTKVGTAATDTGSGNCRMDSTASTAEESP